MRKNLTAWMTKAIFKSYLQTEVKLFLLDQRKRSDLKNKKGLLLIDRFSGHKFEDDEREELEKQLNIFIRYLPAHTTSYLQPLDLNVNGILKNRMRESWIDWFNSSEVVPNKQIIYRWFSTAWKSITPLNIIKAFLTSGLSCDISGKEDILSHNVRLLREKNAKEEEPCVKGDPELKKFFEDPYESPENIFYADDSQLQEELFFSLPDLQQKEDSIVKEGEVIGLNKEEVEMDSLFLLKKRKYNPIDVSNEDRSSQKISSPNKNTDERKASNE